MITGDNGIITNATYAKFATEIKSLEEQAQLKQVMSNASYFGTVNEVLETNSIYNDLLYIEDGELVYISSKASKREKEWLEQLGIEPMSDYFVVSFESSDGTEIPSQTIKNGEKVKRPINPIKEGYEFDGWYYLKEIGSGDNITYEEIKFDFNMKILSNYSLYAKYVGEAIMITRNNSTAFWQAEYREKITSISFEKVYNVIIPENAESWRVNQDGTSEIIAYVVSDENSGLSLHIVSKYEIYAPCYLARYFNNFPNLISIDFTNFKTNRVRNAFYLFAEDTKLEQMNIELLRTNMVETMANMFYKCSSLETLNLYNFDTSNVTNMESMFQGCSNLKNLDISKFNTNNVKNIMSMFRGCSTLESLNLNNFNTENVINMQYMFEGNTNLKNLNLGNFNTSNVMDMRSMFQGCSSLEKLDLSSFDTNNVTNMQDMFSQTGLKNLNISNFNTEKVTSMFRMFQNSTSLESVNLSGFDNRNLTTVERMFYDCTNLKNVNLLNFNTSQITKMTNVFAGCNNIEELDLSSFDTAKVENAVAMFYNCKNMKEIKVSIKWDLTKASTANMFLGCGVQSVTTHYNTFVAD